ncbi:protein KAKU4-like [Camellia sinensis]|uniref:protein KAKU4-like n=1 Tax=Camellia sinensis TaxID=4442 RepID=UPI001035BBF8|nr:protein KAKU4-like [Camellia sinensis]XP_028113576.1 protein KAKU4-like [Camellia sinensis]
MDKVTKGGLGSPVDMAEWYMHARPPWTSPSKDYVEFRTLSAMGREILKEETPSIAGNVLSSSKCFSVRFLYPHRFRSSSFSLQTLDILPNFNLT